MIAVDLLHTRRRTLRCGKNNTANRPYRDLPWRKSADKCQGVTAHVKCHMSDPDWIQNGIVGASYFFLGELGWSFV